MGRVRYDNDVRPVCRSKGRGARYRRQADRRDVGERAAARDVVFQVGADTKEVCACQSRPVDECAAHAEERVIGLAHPAADGLGRACPEPDLVAVDPSALVRVGRDFAVDTGPELELHQHRVILTCLSWSRPTSTRRRSGWMPCMLVRLRLLQLLIGHSPSAWCQAPPKSADRDPRHHWGLR